MPVNKDFYTISGSSGQSTGYKINQSIVYNDGSDPVLYKSISSTSSSTTNTISMWVKRGQLGNSDSGSGSDAYGQTLFQSGRTASNYMLHKLNHSYYWNCNTPFRYNHNTYNQLHFHLTLLVILLCLMHMEH